MSSTSPVSIAGGTSAAAAGGSVIDVATLVSQLVQSTRTPQDTIIANKSSANTAQISALGQLKSALSTFQSALSSLDTPSSFNAEKATSSDNTIFTATADSHAVAGSYDISVSKLAQAQQIVSTPFTAGAAATVGIGNLQLSLGNTSFNVNIDNSNSSLAGIAAAINSASGNPGITASVITGSDGAHLVLQSTQTGAANTIEVKVTSELDGGTGLQQLGYAASNTANYTQKTQAQDADFTISGIEHTSASNTVSDALSGVTFTLVGTTSDPADTQATTPSSATLTIGSDTSAIESNISNFVQAYNTMLHTMTTLGSYDQASGTAGPMLGDALLLGIQNQIRSALYNVVNTGSSQYNSLASIGVTTNKDGTLSLDTGTLSTALSTNPTAVSTIFSGTGGVASALNTAITNELAKGGAVDSRSTTLVGQSDELTKETDDLDTQMTALSASLTQQYSALNALLSSLQTMSAFLTQQFAALPKVQSSSG
jgi:flagellar hook-associated protein 2